MSRSYHFITAATAIVAIAAAFVVYLGGLHRENLLLTRISTLESRIDLLEHKSSEVLAKSPRQKALFEKDGFGPVRVIPVSRSVRRIEQEPPG